MQPLNLPFKVIAGYHLVHKLGSGGMGDVYKGFHKELERTAAVKILHQPEMADRFRNEAYIQSGVNHPNIARLYEYTTAGNNPCIIMEYVDGDTLDDFLRRKTRLNNDEAIAILKQITAALSYLHGKQIYHRDIKPQNFKVQKDGTVKMLDFGIAKHRYSPKFTREGFVVGTTEYMAPEQFEQRGEIRSDIWSLGVMAYEMMTGFMPFEAGNPAAQQARLQNGSYTNPKVLIPAISDQMVTIIDRCLRVNPKARATASQINSLLHGRHTGSHNYLPVAKLLVKHSKVISIGVAGMVVLLFMITLSGGSPDQGNTGNDKITNSSAAEKAINTSTDIESVDKAESSNKTQSNRNSLSAHRKITINVPGIQHAYISFPDGTTRHAPFDIKGRDGDQYKFTISAAGYQNKEVQLELRMGPQTYDFILEKIN